jgi:hypothetical protein
MLRQSLGFASYKNVTIAICMRNGTEKSTILAPYYSTHYWDAIATHRGFHPPKMRCGEVRGRRRLGA